MKRLAPALRRLFARRVASIVAIAAAVTVPTLPSLVSRYGYSDDYWFLGYEKSGRDLVHDLTRDHARPVLGLVYAIGRPMVGSIDGLVWARLFGLAGVLALALAMRWAARSAGFSERFALALAIGVGLLPGVQLYVVWASGAPIGWVSALSIVASQQLVSAGPSLPLATRVRVVAFLAISALTYQPAVGFFVVGLVLALLSPRPDPEPRRQIRRHTSALAAALAVVLAWMVGARLTLGKADRTGLSHRPLHKASWFVTEVLDNATNAFDITPSHVVEVVVLGLIATVIVVISRRYGRRQGPIVAAALVAALPVSYTPNLIAVETWAAYRTLAALSTLVLVFVLVAAREISQFVAASVSRALTRRRLDAAFSLALVAATAVIAAVVATTMYDDLIRPQTDELAAFRGALRATYDDDPDTIAVRQLVEPPSPPARYDEFRMPSLAKEWVPVGLARATLRADGRDPDATRIVRLAPGDPAPAGATVIEIRISAPPGA